MDSDWRHWLTYGYVAAVLTLILVLAWSAHTTYREQQRQCAFLESVVLYWELAHSANELALSDPTLTAQVRASRVGNGEAIQFILDTAGRLKCNGRLL